MRFFSDLFETIAYIDPTVVKDLVATIYPILGLYIAYQGLSTWRRTLIGTEERKVAKQVVFDANRLIRELNSMRSYLTFISKPQLTEEQEVQLSVQEKGWIATCQHYEKRMKSLNELDSALRMSSLEAKVLFGQAAYDVVTPLFKDVNTYFLKLNEHLEFIRPKGARRAISSQEELDKFVFEGLGGDFDKTIDEHLNKVDEYYGQWLHGRTSNKSISKATLLRRFLAKLPGSLRLDSIFRRP